MLRKTYDALLKLAAGPRAEPALAAVSFAEASFFPLPPDLMLAPMTFARPERWLRYAIVCTVASVLGGLAGYAIGHFLIDTVGAWIINLYGYADKMQDLEAVYAKWGFWFIIVKGFTPIPFKLVTIASGIFHYSLPMFIAGSVLTRGLRFLLVGWVCQKFGPAMAPVIEKRIGMVAGGVAALIVAGVAAAILIH